MAIDTEKFRVRFIDEARKQISEFTKGVLDLEQLPHDEALKRHIFRTIHTLKGSSNMMGFTELSQFAHEVEHLLSSIQQHNLITSSLTDLLLTSVDVFKLHIDAIEKRLPPPPENEQLLSQLRTFSIEPSSNQVTQTTPSEQQEVTIVAPSDEQETLIIRKKKLDELIAIISDFILLTKTLQDRSQEISNCTNLTKKLTTHPVVKADTGLSMSVQSLESHIAQLSSHFSQEVYALSQLQETLRDSLYSLRMVPLALIFDKYTKIVREIATKFHKDVQLVIRGQETEMDKFTIDMIDEAIIQLIRNAIDHGIESIEERTASGKKPKGTISIEATYERGMAKITISDDGRGIPLTNLVQKAIDKHLISQEEGDFLIKYRKPDSIAHLICTPGLSGADIITNLSGRGIGMDIVHQNIVRKLHGTMEISTEEGKGTTFTIIMPLNAAIMHVTIFGIQGGMLALPSHTIQEAIRISPHHFITVAGKEAIRIREQIIPIIRLEPLFYPELQSSSSNDSSLALIIKTSVGVVAIYAQSIIRQENFIIQPIPPHSGDSPWVSGCIATETRRLILLINTQLLMDLVKQTPNTKKTDATTPQRIHILVADDSMSTREIEKSILESYGYIVDVASDGREALEMAMDTQYDLIVTDIEMPRMDGFTLTKELRADKGYRHTPIILVTSRDSKEDKMRGAQCGADAYIVKSSFDQEQLIQTIRSLTQ